VTNVRALTASTWRNLGVALTALVCLCLIGLARRDADPTSGRSQARPNVVLVVIDTLRPDHLNHYGYARPTAAALDSFAAEATRFEEAFSPSSWTAPSAASLHTGLLPSRHRLAEYGAGLNAEVVTLAETLRAAGWHTVGHSFNPHVSRKTGFAQGFEDFDDFAGGPLSYPDVSVMVDRVAAWLDDAPETPFFLYLQPMNTHGPYRVPPSAEAALLGRAPSREFRYYGLLMADILRRGGMSRRAEVTPAYLQSLIDQYDTAIRYTADQISRVFAMLREAGLYDRSLIIVTADHGEELFDHGGFSHGYSLHSELVHVPLYVKLPGQHQSSSVRARASLTDLVPTVLDVLGLPRPDPTDGVSLRALLPGAPPTALPWPERVLVHEVTWTDRCVARAIVSGHHKLIEVERNYEGRGDEILLFDVERDPAEHTNLASSRPEVVDRLQAELAQTMVRAKATAIGRAEIVIRELDQERLRALGYL
jgi:arylsulfatase A-like enzyme